jgi:hypothetical protein
LSWFLSPRHLYYAIIFDIIAADDSQLIKAFFHVFFEYGYFAGWLFIDIAIFMARMMAGFGFRVFG